MIFATPGTSIRSCVPDSLDVVAVSSIPQLREKHLTHEICVTLCSQCPPPYYERLLAALGMTLLEMLTLVV
jgi:hypothetical protein